MLILFPSDYFNNKSVEPDYSIEYDAVCQLPEFKIVLYNYDGFVAGEPVKEYPKDYYNGLCIYRGWMLAPAKYQELYEVFQKKRITLINTPDEYNACHLFPNVYDLIETNTAKCLFFKSIDDVNWELINSTFIEFIIKDYVKSVKGEKFPLSFKTPVVKKDMDTYMTKFMELRGKLYTGGIVIKEYINLKKYGETTNEYRAFFINGQLLSLCRNSNQHDRCNKVPIEFVYSFNNLPSNYYTVDFGELDDGSWIVIEVGDGQVSGLSPSQNAFIFYEDILRILLQE